MTLEELGRQLAAYRGSPRSIILRADRGTPYESVVAVMDQALQQDYTVALATVPVPEAPCREDRSARHPAAPGTNPTR